MRKEGALWGRILSVSLFMVFIVFLVSIFILFIWKSNSIAGTMDNAELSPAIATITTGDNIQITFIATNDKTYTLKTFHAEFAYPDGLDVYPYPSSSPSAAIAKVNTRKRTITLEWSNITPNVTVSGYLSITNNTPAGTYTISPTKIYYVDNNRKTYTGSCNSAQIIVQQDTVSPAAPTNVRSDPGEGVINVHWDAVSESDLYGYVVYRRTPGTSYSKSSSHMAYTISYTDTNIQSGQAYYYAVTAIDNSGNESVLSTETGETYYDLEIGSYNAGVSSAVGDINGDGKPDIVLGGIYYSEGRGKHLVSGQKIEIYFGDNMTGIPDVTLNGENQGDKFGNSLTVVDLNNDGYDDIVVGAPYYTPPEGGWGDLEIGKIYVYAGGPQVNTTPVYTRLGTQSYGNNWNSIYWTGGHFGSSVARAGDVNGDGYQDVVIGAPMGGLDRGGRIFLLRGSSSLLGLGNDSFWYSPAWQYMGTSLAAAGDVNSDGYGDIIAGGPGDNDNTFYGRAYLLSGGPYALSEMAAFSTGESKDGFGTVVSSAGDINADGYPDIGVIDGKGAVRIYYGRPSFRNEPDSILYQATNFLAPIGDINNDGYDDFVVDGPAVYFSNTAGDMVPDILQSGLSLIAVGDVNGDGVKDLITRDASSGVISVLSIASYLTLPDIILQSPRDHAATDNHSITVQGSVRGNVSRFMVNGQVVSLQSDGTFNVVVSLVQGENMIEILAETPYGEISKRNIVVTRTPPNPLVVTITSPPDNSVVNTASIAVTGTVNDPFAVVTVNGIRAFPLADGTFSSSVSDLLEGPNTLTVTASDSHGNISSQSITVMLLTRGTISGTVTNSANMLPLSGVSVAITDSQGAHSAVTDAAGFYAVSNVTQGNFLARFTKAGYIEQDISGALAAGETKALDVQLSSPLPLTMTITSPYDGAVLNASPITVTGSVTNNASVTVNGAPAVVDGGAFSVSVPLSEGQNTITGSAADQYGQTAFQSITVTLLTKGGITGAVTDSSSGLSLSQATVSVTDSTGAAHTTSTAADGTYTFTDIPAGSFTETTSKDGYTSANSSGTVYAGQTTIVDVSLIPIIPVISGINVSGTTTESAIVTWTTDQPSDGLVEYGTTTAYGSFANDSTFTTSHSVTLENLSSGVTYHFRIKATNGYGMSVTTTDNVFSTLQFSVKTLGDYGNVTVMEVKGNYDSNNPDGTVNYLPRQEIAREFIKNHADDYDFMIVFSNFDFAMPEAEAKAFYLGVKNDVQGIGKAIFDDSASYGSNKLQGIIDMGNISNKVSGPSDPRFEDTLATVAHEQMHRWGASVRFKDASGNMSTALLGKDGAHWSYLLDSDASVMYGNDWQDNKDGTFTSTGKAGYYSALDLYLAGFYDESQVPPMLLIDNPSIDPAKLPEVGTTITGNTAYVAINDIIAAEGDRIPDASTSQKTFKAAFILITEPNTFTGNELPGLENIRNGWAGKFAQLTGGKGSVADVAPEITIVVTSPSNESTITGPDVTVKGAVINTTGKETGVTVNGVLANVYGNQFIANHVPLAEGSNTLTITATDSAGTTASAAISVDAVPGDYIRLAPNIESGISPLEVTLRIDGSFSIENADLHIEGPTAAEIVDNPSPDEYTVKFNSEGFYNITASATGPDGKLYEDTITITVTNKEQLDRLLKAKWEGMKGALADQDIFNAMNYFLPSSQSRYQQAFNIIIDDLPQLISQMQNIEMIYLKGDVAKYRIRRSHDIDGVMQTITYYIYFFKDADGVWKIDRF
jgi:hypothetical protein